MGAPKWALKLTLSKSPDKQLPSLLTPNKRSSPPPFYHPTSQGGLFFFLRNFSVGAQILKPGRLTPNPASFPLSHVDSHMAFKSPFFHPPTLYSGAELEGLFTDRWKVLSCISPSKSCLFQAKCQPAYPPLVESPGLSVSQAPSSRPRKLRLSQGTWLALAMRHPVLSPWPNSEALLVKQNGAKVDHSGHI